MDDNKTILVINAIINKENMEEVHSYMGSMMAVFAQNGGKLIERYKTVEQLAGEHGPEIVALIEFPNANVIKEMIGGEGFGALAESRTKAFTKLNMMICSEM